MKRAAAIVLVLCCCSLRAARNNASTCSSDEQCGGGDNVCFIGQCRGHSASLALVSVEVQPASGSAFAVTQAANLNLQQSVVQNFTMLPSVLIHGTVSQPGAGGDLSGTPAATVTFTRHTTLIADRVQQASAVTDSSGSFSIRVASGDFDVEVRPPAPLPPFHLAQTFSTSDPLALTLPAKSALVSVLGSVSAGGEDLSGASIAAVDADADLISAPGQISSGNSFSLLLPPSTGNYFLEVGPPGSSGNPAGPAGPPDAGPNVPPPSGIASLPNYDQVPGTTNITLPLPQVATLSGTVVDPAGNPLANVPVYTRSSSDEPFKLARSVSTGSDGTFTLVLRAGSYLVEAAPLVGTSVAISPTQKVILPSSGMAGLQLVCPPKILRAGFLFQQNGHAAGQGYQITATRAADPLLTTRLAVTTPTDSSGQFLIAADPGTYRLEVTPPSRGAAPRHIAQVDISADSPDVLPIIRLDAAVTAVGNIHGTPAGGKDGPLPGATVSFFAHDASGASVLLGSALTDQNGNYSCVLPDIANP